MLTATQADLAGKIRSSDQNVWYVRCRHCKTENRLNRVNVPTEADASYALKQSGWRLSNPRKKYIQRNWSCPPCAAEWWGEETPTAMETDTGGSAGQLAAVATALSFDDLNSEVEQLNAEVQELNAEVFKWSPGVLWHVKMKRGHVAGIRKLRREIKTLRAEVIAARIRRQPRRHESHPRSCRRSAEGAQQICSSPRVSRGGRPTAQTGSYNSSRCNSYRAAAEAKPSFAH